VKTKELNPQFHSPDILQTGWIDIHTHLNFLEITPEQAIEEGQKKGLHHFITIGTEPNDLPIVLELAQRLAPQVYCTLGIHPHEGQVYNQEVEAFLRQNLSHPRVVAVGEIGLDYYYNNSPKQEQLAAFRAQMQLAAEFNLPVEIHTRDAEDDTIQILNEFRDKVTGVIHCFTGTQKLADAALDCGYNISFSGIVTFKKAQDLQQVCLNTPIERMHVETDAPFLAPTPLRGQKNQPDFMLWTAQFVADLKGMELLPFCQQMKLNAQKLFPKLQWASAVDSPS
jgi:TatD DNase family protein